MAYPYGQEGGGYPQYPPASQNTNYGGGYPLQQPSPSFGNAYTPPGQDNGRDGQAAGYFNSGNDGRYSGLSGAFNSGNDGRYSGLSGAFNSGNDGRYSELSGAYGNQPPPTTGGPVPINTDGKLAKSPSKYKDWWAAVLFFLNLGGFAVVAFFSISALVDNGVQSDEIYSKDGIRLFGIAAAIGFVLSLCYILIVQIKAIAGFLLHVSYFFAVALFGAIAAYYFVINVFFAGILMALFAVMYLFLYLSFRKRIPFARVLLITVISVTRKFYGTVITAILVMTVQLGFVILWILSLLGSYEWLKDSASCSTSRNRSGLQTETCTNGPLIAVIVYLAFSLYWITQMLSDLVHVTNSGVFASYYFYEKSETGYPTQHVTLSAFKRASTYSLGSVCLGSLILAIVRTIRAVLYGVATTEDGCGGFIAACAACFVGCIEGIIEYFNHYAFAQVAIYGKSYVVAAKDTWKLFKARGFDAIINDSLISNVLVMGAVLVGAVCALFGGLYISGTDPAFDRNGDYTAIIVIVCFFLGFIMFFLIGGVIESGVATTFVCLAEDPQTLLATKPDLYYQIQQVYPQANLSPIPPPYS